MSDDPIPPSPEGLSEDAPPQAMEDLSAPVATEKNGETVEFRPGGMRRYRKGDVEVDEGSDEDGEVLVVSVRLRRSPANGVVRRQFPVEVEEPEVRSKINRFATKPAALPSPGVAPAAVAAPTVDDPDAPPPGAPRAKFTPRAVQDAEGVPSWERSPLLSRVIKYTILTLVLLGAGFMAGRRFGQPTASSQRADATRAGVPVPKLTTTWAPGRMAQLDAMLAADDRGDLKQARQIALDIKKDLPDSPELDLYLTTIQVRENEFKIPENDLARVLNAFTPPLEAAAINEHLGFLYARHRDFPQAVAAFSDAASTDPLNPVHFQHWAESERRQGHFQEAIDHFQQALARLPIGSPSNTSRREEIEMKIHLTQIEWGKDQDLKAEIDARLKDPVPSGYWWLTAAGYGLQHNDTALAASSLQKARATLSADDYNALINDYFFHSFAGSPNVGSLLPPNNPAEWVQPFLPRMGYFIDP